MPSLMFPNSDALRLALVAELLPRAVTGVPGLGHVDDQGQIWIESPEMVNRSVIASLTRIGVYRHGPGTAPRLEPIRAWADLLSLHGDHPAPQPQRSLIVAENAVVAKLVNRIQRRGPQAIAFGPMPDRDATWLLVPEYHDNDRDDAEVYHEQSPGNWMLHGWHHPLVSELPQTIGQRALHHPHRTCCLLAEMATHYWPSVCATNQAPPRLRARPEWMVPVTRVPGTIRLRTVVSGDSIETLRLIPPEGIESFRQAVRNVSEIQLADYQAATQVDETGRAWIVIRSVNAKPTAWLFAEAEGFHEWASTMIFLPKGMRFSPELRIDTIRTQVGHVEKSVTILRIDADGGIERLQLALSRFVRLSELVEYRTPRPQALAVVRSNHALGRLPSFTALPEAEPSTENFAEPHPSTAHRDKSWIGRSIDRVRQKVTRLRQPTQRVRLPARASIVSSWSLDSQVEPKPIDDHWNQRRAELEARVLSELPRMVPSDRARLWSELADVYTALGNPPNAGLCWLNAIWDARHAEPQWFDSWQHAEALAARVEPETLTPETLLDATPNAQRARLAALLLLQSTTLEPGTMRQLLKLVQLHETDLPIRLVWLVQQHVTITTHGDTLGLARCRDRLFARLVEHGPGLDLDAPAFFRFQSGDHGDRYVRVREWLIRVREPMQRWLQRTLNVGRLQWAGIDAELRRTRCYADLMLAWGLSRLGDRARARDLQNHALTDLDPNRKPGIDGNVHQTLVRLFSQRIVQARDGRLALFENAARNDELPLDELGRYAVAKLRSVSNILEPHGPINPYEGRDSVRFLGNDQLFQELIPLLHHHETAIPNSTIDALLNRLDSDPSARSTPRIVHVLLTNRQLDAARLTRLLPKVSSAIEWIPEQLRLSDTRFDESFMPRLAATMLRSASQAAARHQLAEPFMELGNAIIRQCDNPNSLLLQSALACSTELFQSVRRLKLIPLAHVLMEHFVPLLKTQPNRQALGCAIGWFTLGNDEAGYRLLNNVCEELYIHNNLSELARTELAIDYAVALGHAPLRIALGRLEELFYRLDGIRTRGATNRYYTLKPLQLIDTIITAVVGDAFEVSQAVRDWLDDDEYLMRQRITNDMNQTLIEDRQ